MNHIRGWREKLVTQNARQRLLISLGIATFAFLPSAGAQITTRAIVAWDVFTFCFLTMSGVAMVSATPDQIHDNANAQDGGRRFVFMFAMVAAGASLFAVVLLLRYAKGLQGLELYKHLGLSVMAVVGSWLLVHTTYAFRYAHMFYDDATCPKHDAKDGEHVGGLEFPNEPQPDYLDFAYYAFVVGMTFQVSDVQITARSIRRLTLAHSIQAFAFNTMILALCVNVLSSLLS